VAVGGRAERAYNLRPQIRGHTLLTSSGPLFGFPRTMRFSLNQNPSMASMSDDGVLLEQSTAEINPGVDSLAEFVTSKLSEGSWLRKEPLLVENWQWLGLLCLISVAVVVERLVAFVLRRMARGSARSERVDIDEDQLTRFVRPFGVMITWWLFLVMLPMLELENAALIRGLDLIGGVLISVAGVLAAWRLVDVVCDFLKSKAQHTNNTFDDMLVPLLRRTLKIFVVVIGMAYFSSKVTEDFYKVIAGISIGGAVLAFAFKDSLENVFGTFTVLLDKPFQLGDWITVGEVDGSVESVGFRSTRVRTFYNSLITVPNRHFISAKVDNWGARSYRRIKTTLGVTYSTPPETIEAFCEGIRELIRTHPYTRKDYFHVYLNGFGPSSLDILLYCFLKTPDWSMELREKHRLFADILRLADRLGVEFAFPTQSLHVVPEGTPFTGERPTSDQDGAVLGRQAGRSVAEETLSAYGGNKPGRVTFDDSPPVPSAGQEGSAAGEGDGL
jgi:MscS family membrane protein